jgi:hypothetical protein
MPGQVRFKATAIGAGGFIAVPFNEIIEVQAASALPEIGGYGTARSVDFRYREILSFDLAHTEVVGSRLADADDGVHVFSTLVKSTVEGFNVMGMVTADRIVANLVSTFKGESPGELSVRLVGSRFENLRIAGIPVKVILAVDTLDKYDTYQSLRYGYESDECVRDLFGDLSLRERFDKAPSKVAQWFSHGCKIHPELPAIDGISRVSLVRGLEPEDSGFDCWGHVIHVHGFGTIRLGEVAINRLTRSVTMVQIDLGCPITGRLMCCASEDGCNPS